MMLVLVLPCTKDLTLKYGFKVEFPSSFITFDENQPNGVELLRVDY